jgi:L-alanine-DL-glutamate epimerase-like enolase superfamily enzyme
MADALRNDGRPGIGAMALSAVDTALWDLKARVLDLPLHRLLGAVRTEVPVYGSGGFTTYDEERLATELDQWAEAGFTAVKIKVGEDKGRRTGRDTARVRQVRRTMGPLVEVMVDANGAHDAKHAIGWFDEVADQGVTWFEEPVSSDDLAGLTRVRDAIHADVTAGEYGYSLPYFRQMLDAGAVDCLQVDVTRAGGITGLLYASGLAAGFGLDVSGHCAPQLSAHALCAVPRLRHLEYFHDHVRLEAMLFDGVLEPEDGGVLRPDRSRPGNGLELKREEAEQWAA